MVNNVFKKVISLFILFLLLSSLNINSFEILGTVETVEGSIKVNNASGTYKVTANALNVRSGNGTKYKTLGSLKKNQEVKVTGKTSNGWYRITYKGKTGYVSGKYIKKKTVKKKKTTTKKTTAKKKSNTISVSKASGTYKITANALNVRSGNGTKYKALGTLKKNQEVKVTGKTSNGWYRITYKGKTGYISGKYIKKKTTTKKTTAKKKSNTISVSKASGTYTITASSLNVRSGNGTKYKTLGSLKKNQEVKVTGKTSNGWYRITYKGKTGYISGKYIKKKTVKKTNEKKKTESKNVVDNMKNLGNSKQVILVTTKGYNTSQATIQTFEKDSKGKWNRKLNITGYIGKNGFAKNKKEGDGKSPTGKYKIGTAFGYKGNPGTKLNFKNSTNNDVWVDDPKSKYYNTWQKNNKKDKDWKSAESMMHRLYEYGFVINYNTAQTPGKGSAIFMHVGSSYTVGCTATSQSNLISIMKWIDPKKNPVIIQTPESELSNY